MAQRDTSHLMSDDEWAQWEGRLASSSPADTAAPKGQNPEPKQAKPTSARLNQMLLSAAWAGESSEIEKLLRQGASPNARERSKPRRSALMIAMDNGNPKAALALMRAGGWAAPSQWASCAKTAFDDKIAAGPLSGGDLEAAMTQTINLFFMQCSTWANLLEAAAIAQRDKSLDSLSPASLLRQAVGCGRWNMARDAMDSGIPFDESCWAKAVAMWSSPYLQMGEEALSTLAITATRPEALASMTPSASQDLFRLSIRLSSKLLMESLLGARLRPSADWTIHPLKGYPAGYPAPHRSMPKEEASNVEMASMSLVTACSIDSGNSALFQLVSNFPPALAAARQRNVSPWRLRDMSIGRLQELNELKIPIDGVDCYGQGLFHVWAAVDSLPRSGWATMAKKFPDMFLLHDANGRTGAQAMSKKLSSSEAQEFNACLARVEAREIRQATGPAPAKKSPASKPRPRL